MCPALRNTLLQPVKHTQRNTYYACFIICYPDNSKYLRIYGKVYRGTSRTCLILRPVRKCCMSVIINIQLVFLRKVNTCRSSAATSIICGHLSGITYRITRGITSTKKYKWEYFRIKHNITEGTTTLCKHIHSMTCVMCHKR